MTKAKIDARQRAAFKEVARQIIGRDRAARRHGVSQNTIGEIERALVDAYVMGQAHLESAVTLSSGETNDCIEWTEITAH